MITRLFAPQNRAQRRAVAVRYFQWEGSEGVDTCRNGREIQRLDDPNPDLPERVMVRQHLGIDRID